MAVLTLLNKDWLVWKGDASQRLQIALMATALVVGFGAALRGEEIPRADLGALQRNWKAALEHLTALHIPIALIGKFKSKVGEKTHTVPLAFKSQSGLPIKKWVEQVVGLYEHMGIIDGPLFQIKAKSSYRCAKV